jgi:hypothetical protein
MTREEHKKAIIENLNAMVDKLEDDNEYFDALYHLDMVCKEIEPCEDCISRKAAIDKMQELEDEDIEAYGCSIPEGFDGKRAIEALKSLPSIQKRSCKE